MKTEYLYTDLFNMLIEGLRSLEPSEEIAGEAANVLIEMKADIASLTQQLAEAKKDAERMQHGLENCRLLASRHRKEDWALLILGFCAEGGVVGSVTR